MVINGEIMAAKKKSTIVDVAKKAGVSVSTVSVFVNNKNKYVAPELKNRIEHAVRELNYTPNSIARSMKSRRTKTIGLILTNITSPVTAPLVRIIQHSMMDSGYDTMIVMTEENKIIEANAVKNFVSKMVDGLIVCPVKAEAYDHLDEARAVSHIPIINLERSIPSKYGIPSIMTNNFEISYQAVEHLIQHRRKRIALISSPETGTNISERIHAYKQALKDNHLFDPSLMVETDYRGSNANQLAKKLLSENKIDAIFTVSQSITLGAYKAIIANGLKVGSDIAMIGYDDADWMGIAPTPISTIKQPIAEIAKTAVSMMQGMMKSSPLEAKSLVIPSQLILRESCGCCSS